MECAAKNAASARILRALSQHRPNLRLPNVQGQQRNSHPFSNHPRFSRRYASSSSSSSSSPSSAKNSTTGSKPIFLEKPDKFRPPSHASRRNARSTTSLYGAGGAYNQGMSAAERAKSRTKTYPHMFPNEGTRMHWFLTTRWVHVVITFGVLMTLAFTSVVSTWSQTSPYAHLIPPLSMLFFSPIKYFSELVSVYRLHTDYTTQQTAEKRRQNILDAQKRRLYRRAHGMEDLEADEVSGPDVRGLVEWDDGLTNKERERGGQYTTEMIAARMQEMGQRPGETLPELMERKRGEEVERVRQKEEERARKNEEAERAEEERLVRIGAKRPEQERKPKLWLGIW